MAAAAATATVLMAQTPATTVTRCSALPSLPPPRLSTPSISSSLKLFSGINVPKFMFHFVLHAPFGLMHSKERILNYPCEEEIIEEYHNVINIVSKFYLEKGPIFNIH